MGEQQGREQTEERRRMCPSVKVCRVQGRSGSVTEGDLVTWLTAGPVQGQIRQQGVSTQGDTLGSLGQEAERTEQESDILRVCWEPVPPSATPRRLSNRTPKPQAHLSGCKREEAVWLLRSSRAMA